MGTVATLQSPVIALWTGVHPLLVVEQERSVFPLYTVRTVS